MRKKTVIGLLMVTAAVIAGSVYFELGNRKEQSLVTSGIVEGTEVNLSSKISGRIVHICCNEGDRVEKGAVVVRLESSDLEASVRQAEAAIARSEAEINAAASAIADARANVESTAAETENASAEMKKVRLQTEELKREMDRTVSLFSEELVPRETLDRAVSAYEVSAAAYESAKANHLSAQAGKKSAQARLDTSVIQLEAAKKARDEAAAVLSYHEARLNDTVVKSPISGTVVFKAFEEGEITGAGTVILTVVDMDNLYVRADMDETKISRVMLHGEASVRIPSSGKAYRGTIYEIGIHADFATQRDVVRGRQDIKTFRIKIRVEGPDGILKPGMTVDVEIPQTKPAAP